MAHVYFWLWWSKLITLGGRRGVVARPNLVPNPLMSFPRNQTCFCNSGKKFKHCHRKKLPPEILASLAAETKDVMRRAGIK